MLWNLIALTLNLLFLFLQSLVLLSKHFLSFYNKWSHFNFLNMRFFFFRYGQRILCEAKSALLCHDCLNTETQRGQISFNWQSLSWHSPDFEWELNGTRMTPRRVISRACSISILLLGLCHLSQPTVALYVSNCYSQGTMVLPV